MTSLLFTGNFSQIRAKLRDWAVWPVRVSDVLGNAKFASLSLLLNVCKVEFGLLLIATAIGQYRLHASLKAL